MTPPLFLVADLGAGASIVLTGAEAHHAGTVKRLAPGEVVWLADGNGGLAETTVASVARDQVVFAVTHRRQLAERRPRLVVVQALPKGERAELAVEVLTELGVDEIVPWSAARAITQWHGERVERGVQKWRRTAREAAKQSRRARVPVVSGLASTAAVAERVSRAPASLLLHEDATGGLGELELSGVAEILLVVGPEGGLSEDELALFTGRGARPVRLGPEVLRTSTAGAAALAVLSVQVGRWR
ncbi:MAG TPA: 16S rRNA (uracil(1498)-N(3))-methyltransferase [Jatrophihabitans sp.]|nr:16S rRNA (uracil(1498)-N(3))-methyltransferase [Jatrophihabitans sp.]